MSIFDCIGPFIVEPDVDWPADDLAIVSVDGEKQIGTVTGNGDRETAIANLFAASPFLLRACQIAFRLSCDRSEGRMKWSANDQMVHEALALALRRVGVQS